MRRVDARRPGVAYASAHSEEGVVGKILVVSLLLIVVVGIALIDAGSIIYTKVQVSGAADAAARQAAAEFGRTQDAREAERAALQTVHDRDAGSRVTRVEIFRQSGTVRVTVRKEAATLVVQRVDFLEDLGVVTSTSTAGPPAK